MLVCICNSISDRDIDSALAEGASSFKDVQKSLGIASSCGQCASFAKDMISEKLAQSQCAQAFHLATEIRV